jgi:type IV pilus assembly protein PilC
MTGKDRNWLETKARISSKPHKKVTRDDRLTLLNQLATLLNAGTPLLETLQMSAEQTLSTSLQETVRTIAAQVAAGTPLHRACAQHPKVFKQHWTDIIAVGEMTGEMGTVIQELSVQAQRAEKTRSKLVSAMMYPSIMIVVAFLCVLVMLWKVVPTFAAFFDDFGAKLPGITQAVLDMSGFIRSRGPYMVGGIVISVFALRHWFRRDSGRYVLNVVTMATPVIGEMIVQVAMQKLAGTLALLLKSGIPLLQALGTLRDVMQSNILYRRAIQHVENRVSNGAPLAGSLEETKLFPTMVVGMIRVGEDTGKLPQVLDQISSYYGQKMDIAVQRAMNLVEPSIIILMGVTIGTIMAAIYLPMFQLSSAAG